MNIILNELYHHGIKGMRWGVRRYTNRDGSLNTLGKRHVNAYKTSLKYDKKLYEEADKLISQDKRLKRDYDKASNIDDMDMFDLSLQDYKIAGKEFYEAKKNSYLYDKNNAESIRIGQKIYARLS